MKKEMMKLRNCISFKYTSLFGIYAKNTFRKRWDKVKSASLLCHFFFYQQFASFWILSYNFKWLHV